MKVLEPTPQSKLANVPKWMFVIFGAPKHPNVPVTVQPVQSIYLQIIGITLALYGIFIDQRLVKDHSLSGLFGLGLSMLLGTLIARWLYKKRPYSSDENTIEMSS